VKQQVINWNLNSRNLMINFFFNVLKEKHRSIKGKLPSIDADALGKMKDPIASKLIIFRSNKKTLDSFFNVSKYVHDPKVYYDLDTPCKKANVKFNVLGYDNIERIFPVAKESVPINADKRSRLAFIIPYWRKISEGDLSEEVKSILNQVKE
jgi:hypothetical protein